MAKAPLKILSVRVLPEIHAALGRNAEVFNMKPLTLAARYLVEGIARDQGREGFLAMEEAARARRNRDHLRDLANKKANRDPATVTYDSTFDFNSLERRQPSDQPQRSPDV